MQNAQVVVLRFGFSTHAIASSRCPACRHITDNGLLSVEHGAAVCSAEFHVQWQLHQQDGYPTRQPAPTERGHTSAGAGHDFCGGERCAVSGESGDGGVGEAGPTRDIECDGASRFQYHVWGKCVAE